ncbi:uncharacterized protein LOC115443898 isoform X2 [Manduca sexta]|uniref:uncharacterized protein LOC115443898 isoform X2 n=1 Tax=Manduca sexta TaxID=7130 RepID=UPI001182073D|nr:uncharacterized protein LOC115443898 isoform X2 [Manduca sexta]
MTGHNRIRILILFLTVAFISGGQTKSTENSKGTPGGVNVEINNVNQIGNGSGGYGYSPYGYDYDYDYSYVPVERVPAQPKSYCGPNTVYSLFSFIYCALDSVKRILGGGL